MTTLKAYKKSNIEASIQSIEPFVGKVCRVTNYNFVCRRAPRESTSTEAAYTPLMLHSTPVWKLVLSCNFLPKIGNEVFIFDVKYPSRFPLIQIILLDSEDIIENKGSMFSWIDLEKIPWSYSLMHDSFEIVPEPITSLSEPQKQIR